MSLPRMTTRRWMVAVAIVGLFCLMEHRRRAFASLAAYHESRVVARMCVRYRKYLGRAIRRPDLTPGMLIRSLDGKQDYVYFDLAGKVMTTDEVKGAIRHEALAPKYRYAARHPWLPVEPDPPEP
jgi:hypothetical protein